jgi:hypothetical protein
MASGRYVDTELERPRWRFTLTYRVLERASVGIEYNPVAAEVAPLATVFAFFETEYRPALFLGTSSDRIGSPEGTQSYYATAAKALPRVPVSVYGSLAYSEWDEGFNVPFGAELSVWRGLTTRYMYDGEQSHVLLNWFGDRYGVSVMAVWLDTFGISLVGGF